MNWTELTRTKDHANCAETKLIFWLTTFLAESNRILTTLFLSLQYLVITASSIAQHNVIVCAYYSEYDHKIVELGDRGPVSILSLLRIRSNICRQHAPVSEGGRVEL